MSDTGVIPAKSKAMYASFLDPDTLAKAESLSAGDQAYFWTWLYYEIQHRAQRTWLREMEQIAKSRVTEIDELAEPPAEATKPHGWFKVRI